MFQNLTLYKMVEYIGRQRGEKPCIKKVIKGNPGSTREVERDQEQLDTQKIINKKDQKIVKSIPTGTRPEE